jgi:nitrite reductase/ring-hydroxylating ferredoxin subunit
MLVPIGSANDVADGQMHVFDVAGTRVNVASSEGRLYAFDDTCTHMGCSLAKGQLEGTTVTCACHGSQFDVTTGAVMRGPRTASCPLADGPDRRRRATCRGLGTRHSGRQGRRARLATNREELSLI